MWRRNAIHKASILTFRPVCTSASPSMGPVEGPPTRTALSATTSQPHVYLVQDGSELTADDGVQQDSPERVSHPVLEIYEALMVN